MRKLMAQTSEEEMSRVAWHLRIVAGFKKRKVVVRNMG